MRFTGFLAFILITIAVGVHADETVPAKKAKKAPAPDANCRVKLVKEAGMLELSFFANGKEDCLRMADQQPIEATFTQGTIERKRRGAGPDP